MLPRSRGPILPGDFSNVWTPGIFVLHVTKLVYMKSSSCFSFSTDMAGWKALKYYQNEARKAEGRHSSILWIFEALPKRTRLWTESETVKCVRITMNQAVRGIFPGCTGIQTRRQELRVTRLLDRRYKDGDLTDEQRGKWFISYFLSVFFGGNMKLSRETDTFFKWRKSRKKTL